MVSTISRNVSDFVFVMSVLPSKRIFAIGDSHVLPLGSRRGVFRKHLGPMTLNRFGRPGQARKALKSTLPFSLSQSGSEDPKSLPTIVLSFGEIDLRVHVLRQSNNQNISPFRVVDGLIDSVMSAVTELRTITQARIIFLAPTPPTDIVINPQFPTSGSLSDRIAWRRHFCSTLQAKVNGLGLPNLAFLDVSESFTSSQGALADEFGDGNVHYSKNVGRTIVDLIQQSSLAS